MRKEKTLATLLNGLAKLLNEEAARNPEFAARLEALLSPTVADSSGRKKPAKAEPRNLPDAYAEFAARGDSEFQLWLRDQPTGILHALIRRHDLDATRRSAKWKDAEKLSAFIADQIRSRLARGSGFLRSGQARERKTGAGSES
ncbi:MAG: hypothetical protein ACRD8O_16765 [Bryobacteraceae bacterium]